MTYKYDYLVIGSGIAGMSFALKASRHGRKVAIICKSTLEDANTNFAQGGVASVTNLEVDDFEKHIHDTMVAGDWLSDPAAVEQVVRNAPTARKTAPSTCTARVATQSSASSTTPTTPAPKFRRASSAASAPTATSMSSTTASPSRSSPSTISARL